MPYHYTPELIDNALTYPSYREKILETIAAPTGDEATEKMRPYLSSNSALMDQYDAHYQASSELLSAVNAGPATTWLVITEGWCGDAAFNVPMFHVVEKLAPAKVKLRVVLRDSNLELMDANLTDGGRSIPKLIVLNEALQPVDYWGPRPAGLQQLMKQWKGEGLELKQIIPKVHAWYDADKTQSLQQELIAMIKRYNKSPL